MKHNFVLLLILFAFHSAKGQNIRLISSDSVISILNSRPDSGTLVVNFWATWCRPCVHELPFFTKADSALQGKNIQFVFVSFDPSNTQSKVQAFISKNGMPGTHYIIGNYDMNAFIDRVDRKWEGGIPYTAVITATNRRNKEGAFTDLKELLEFIQK